jgi:branched-chain amino acid transport system substrate-binding protein
MKKTIASVALGLSMLGAAAVPALAQGTIKIGYIDPLSGSGASIGQIGLNELKFIADQVNAQGGVLEKKIKIIGYDNQVSPQVSLVQLQKAIDDGVHIITQGNGSSVGIAIENFITKYNERNPGAGIVYLNYGAIDPILTNQDCSYWQFSFDANSDMKMAALVNFIQARPAIKKIYLIDQDYSFGHSVADAAERMLKAKRPDVQIVGNEFVPLLKVTDFSPYIAQIKASRADTVITSDWGQDFTLLIKAAGQAGLKVNWFTYYAGFGGGPTAIKQANLPDAVYQINESVNNIDYAPEREFAKAYIAHYPNDPVFYPRIVNEMRMAFKAMEDTKSIAPATFIPDLEGMKFPTFSSGAEGFMRKDDHQFIQPLFISVLGPLSASQPFDEEHTGWGWKVAAQIPADATILPTSCQMKRPD